MVNNSTLEKILWLFNRNAELLRLVGAIFLFQSGFSQKDDEENFDHSEKFGEKKAFAYGNFLFYLFCRCLHFSCQIWIESVRNIFICSLNILITVVYLKFFSILWQFIFYWTIINWNFIWNIILNNSIYWDLRNKSVCLNTV